MRGLDAIGGLMIGRDEAGFRRLTLGDPAPWMKDALCREVDPELFFPTGDAQRGQVRDAKTVCGRCPVRYQCAMHALERPELAGIWGGLTDNERRRSRSAARRRPLA